MKHSSVSPQQTDPVPVDAYDTPDLDLPDWSGMSKIAWRVEINTAIRMSEEYRSLIRALPGGFECRRAKMVEVEFVL